MASTHIQIEFPKNHLYEINEIYRALGMKEVDVNSSKEVKKEFIDILKKYKQTLKTYGVKK